MTIERDANGLGIEVDSVGGGAVIGVVAARGAAARQSAVLAGDRIVRVFEYETPTYKEASLLYTNTRVWYRTTRRERVGLYLLWRITKRESLALYLLWQALALIKGSVGGPLELTLLRSPVVRL